MGLRVRDGGGSEGRPVMGGTGVEPDGSAVRATEGVHHLTRKRADFRRVARHEKVDGDTETGVRRIGSSRKDCWREPAYPLNSVERVLSSA